MNQTTAPRARAGVDWQPSGFQNWKTIMIYNDKKCLERRNKRWRKRISYGSLHQGRDGTSQLGLHTWLDLLSFSSVQGSSSLPGCNDDGRTYYVAWNIKKFERRHSDHNQYISPRIDCVGRTMTIKRSELLISNEGELLEKFRDNPKIVTPQNYLVITL